LAPLLGLVPNWAQNSIFLHQKLPHLWLQSEECLWEFIYRLRYVLMYVMDSNPDVHYNKIMVKRDVKIWLVAEQNKDIEVENITCSTR